ncbi:MAG: APC family permease [Terriglobales bacterium]
MEDRKHPELVRAIGRWTLAGLVLNGIIGGGIFGVPSLVAAQLGRASPWAFLIAAAGVGIIIACFAEVGSRFREAGGVYLYAREGFGRLAGIQIAWVAWLARLTAVAANSNLFVSYLAEFWAPATNPVPRLIILTVLVGLLATVNYRGVRGGARLSSVFVVAKLLPLTLFVFLGVILLSRAMSATAPPATGGAWLDGILILVYTFGGFETALLAMSEAKDPQRDVPFSLFIGLAVTTVLFTGIQIVVVTALAAPEMTDRPLAAAAAQFLGPAGALMMTAGALASIYGNLTSNVLNSPRMTYALADRGDFPKALAAVHPRFRTPHVSIVVFGLMTWGLAVAGSFRWNVTLSAVARLLTYGATCAAVIALRKKQPGREAFHLPAGNIVAMLGIAFAVVLVTRMDWSAVVILSGTAAVAFVNWLWARNRRATEAQAD